MLYDPRAKKVNLFQNEQKCRHKFVLSHLFVSFVQTGIVIIVDENVYSDMINGCTRQSDKIPMAKHKIDLHIDWFNIYLIRQIGLKIQMGGNQIVFVDIEEIIKPPDEIARIREDYRLTVTARE